MQGMHSTPKALPCEFCRFWTLVVFFSGPGHQVEAAAARWSKASTKSSGKAMGGFQAKKADVKWRHADVEFSPSRSRPETLISSDFNLRAMACYLPAASNVCRFEVE